MADLTYKDAVKKTLPICPGCSNPLEELNYNIAGEIIMYSCPICQRFLGLVPAMDCEQANEEG